MVVLRPHQPPTLKLGYGPTHQRAAHAQELSDFGLGQGLRSEREQRPYPT